MNINKLLVVLDLCVHHIFGWITNETGNDFSPSTFGYSEEVIDLADITRIGGII